MILLLGFLALALYYTGNHVRHYGFNKETYMFNGMVVGFFGALISGWLQFLTKSPVVNGFLAVGIMHCVYLLIGKLSTEEAVKDRVEQMLVDEKEVEERRYQKREAFENWDVLKSYLGSHQQFEFQKDISLLQSEGLTPRVRTSGVTSILLKSNEMERGIELLGLEVDIEDADSST